MGNNSFLLLGWNSPCVSFRLTLCYNVEAGAKYIPPKASDHSSQNGAAINKTALSKKPGGSEKFRGADSRKDG